MLRRIGPKNMERYQWTNHVVRKMQFYGISESKVKNVINRPTRVEEGIAPRTVAAMQPAGTKTPQEVWVMYQTAAQKSSATEGIKKIPRPSLKKENALTVISAWRYPGVSPERGKIPIPPDIAEELGIIL